MAVTFRMTIELRTDDNRFKHAPAAFNLCTYVDGSLDDVYQVPTQLPISTDVWSEMIELVDRVLETGVSKDVGMQAVLF